MNKGATCIAKEIQDENEIYNFVNTEIPVPIPSPNIILPKYKIGNETAND
jgi:hypothetical protein